MASNNNSAVKKVVAPKKDQGIQHVEFEEKGTNTSRVFVQSEPEQPKINTGPDGRDLLIKKQQSQIDSLRHELKDLNEKLTTTLDKRKIYRDRVATEGSPSSNEVERYQKELESAMTQIKNYQKEIASLKVKAGNMSTIDKLNNMENAIAERNKKIHDLETELRSFQKIKFDYERNMTAMAAEKESVDSTARFIEEIRIMREKYRVLEEKSRNEEKNHKKQQEYVITLEKKYRELCEKFGVSASLNFSRSDGPKAFRSGQVSGVKTPRELETVKPNMLPLLKSNFKTPRSQLHASRDIDKTQSHDMSAVQLQEQLDVLSNSKRALERKLRGEIQQLTEKNHELELINQEFHRQLQEKEKECNILQSRLNEVRRTLKMKPLPPPDIRTESEEGLGAEPKQKYRSEKILPSSTKARAAPTPKGQVDSHGLKLEVYGNEEWSTAFDDGKALKIDSQSKVVKIQKLAIYYQATAIRGIQAWYLGMDGVVADGEAHVGPTRKDNFLMKTVTIEEGDYICGLGGIYAAGIIRSLWFKTHRGARHEVGNAKKDAGAQEFALHIKEKQHPVYLIGALGAISQDGNDDGEIGLCRIGAAVGNFDSVLASP